MRGGCNNEHSFPKGGKNFGRQPSGNGPRPERSPSVRANSYNVLAIQLAIFLRTRIFSRRVNCSDLLILHASCQRRYVSTIDSLLLSLFLSPPQSVGKFILLASRAVESGHMAKQDPTLVAVRLVVHRSLARRQIGGLAASLGIKKLP